MSEFYTDYKEARRNAENTADRLGLDVALRGGKEYTTKGFHVHLASRNDSGYDRAEIVKPCAIRKEYRENPPEGGYNCGTVLRKAEDH